eukprot:gb/GEZN01007816.1/.p1 GENE.gb/GEZN01007816.1/~~gb/GEZN01007816.1/.p1  ORF type:complete len:406 (+),score=44.87 gb/GEZN01007816.1/:76-1293(+)
MQTMSTIGAILFLIPFCKGLLPNFLEIQQQTQLSPERNFLDDHEDATIKSDKPELNSKTGTELDKFQRAYFEKLSMELKEEQKERARFYSAAAITLEVEGEAQTSMTDDFDERYPADWIQSLKNPGSQDDVDLDVHYYFEARDPLHRYSGDRNALLDQPAWLLYNTNNPGAARLTYAAWLNTPPRNALETDKVVAYYTATQLATYALTIVPDNQAAGVSIQLGGVNVVGDMPSVDGNTKEFIFVSFITGAQAGRVGVFGSSKKLDAPRRHHSSFNNGHSVFLAGSGKVQNGRLTAVNPQSGHYQMEYKDFKERICYVLQTAGLTRASCSKLKVEYYENGLADDRYDLSSCFCWEDEEFFPKPSCTSIKFKQQCLDSACYWCNGNKVWSPCRWKNKPAKCSNPEIL